MPNMLEITRSSMSMCTCNAALADACIQFCVDKPCMHMREATNDWSEEVCNLVTTQLDLLSMSHRYA